MSKAKFKVGDKVFVINDKEKLKRISCPSSYAGQKGEVTVVSEDGAFDALIRFSDRKSWWVSLELLKNIHSEKIIIYRNSSEVIAKNTLTGKTGVAKCNPADEFDFEIGAKLAFDRLVEPEPEKPKYYTGKVVCINDSGFSNTKGKIYKVLDGQLEFDGGFYSDDRFKSVEQINNNLRSKFIELIED